MSTAAHSSTMYRYMYRQCTCIYMYQLESSYDRPRYSLSEALRLCYSVLMMASPKQLYRVALSACFTLHDRISLILTVMSGTEEILAREDGAKVGVVLPKLGAILVALRDLP